MRNVKRTQSKAAREASKSPVPWFVALEAARRERNQNLAARATRELARLGVVVTYVGAA